MGPHSFIKTKQTRGDLMQVTTEEILGFFLHAFRSALCVGDGRYQDLIQGLGNPGSGCSCHN